MSFDFSTLITDRTPADVSRVQELSSKIRSGTASESELAEFNSAAMKGAYNHTDLNRVTAAMESLKDRLENYGYNVPGYKRIEIPHDLGGSDRRLPKGYKELTYIQSSGTQYIDTGVNGESGVEFYAGWEFTSIPSSGICIIGSIADNARVYPAYPNKGNWGYGYGSYISGSVAAEVGKKVDIYSKLTAGEQKLQIDGETVLSGTIATSYNNGFPMYMFALNNTGSTSNFVSGKLYNAKIVQNGIIVRNFVPCVNPNGNIGLYDLVTSAFFGNEGTEAFIAGEAIEEETNAPEFDPYVWYEFDYPTPNVMTAYLLNVAAIRAVIAVMESTPSVPLDVSNFMTQEANDIEKILGDVNLLLNYSRMSWYYSGDLFSGEV